MPESKSFLSRLTSELRRRKVPRVAVTYLAVAAAAIGGATAAVSALYLPERAATFVVLVAILGFPVALVVSWVFDLTLEGVKRTEEPEAESRLVLGRPARMTLLSATVLVTFGAGFAFWEMNVAGRAPGAIDAPPAVPLDPNHVAVLYLKDISPTHNLGYLADGLTETLIHRLGAVGALTVVPANGVMPFRGASLPFDSIGRLLHAGSVIDGSVQASGNRVRVSVELVNAATGAQMGNVQIEASSGDPFALQDAVSRQVARSLRKQLGKAIELRRAKKSTDDPRAWEQYLRAVRLRNDARSLDLARDTAGAMSYYGRADSLFDLASREDPNWPEPIIESGWTHLAMARAKNPMLTEVDTTWLRAGLRDADRVLGEHPGYPPAQALRGVLEWFLAQRTDLAPARIATLDSAKRDLAAATTQDSSLARAWGVLAFLLKDEAKFDEARLAARRMGEADPYLSNDPDYLSIVAGLALEFHQIDRADSLYVWGERQYPRDVAYPFSRLLIVASRPTRSGAVDSARALLHRSEALYGQVWQPARFYFAAALARAGLADSARAVEERALALHPDDPWAWHDDAYVALQLEERDRAIALLGRFLQRLPERRPYVAADWWWDSLHQDPRFQRLVNDTYASVH
jgi:TolB-like protein